MTNCSLKGEISSIFASPRLFRNNIGCHYRGTVHNQPYFSGEADPSPLHIIHYGYDLSPKKMSAKTKRTIQLLEKQIPDKALTSDSESIWEQALTRAIALAMAQSSGVTPSAEELQAYSEEFRRSRGLLTPEATQGWLERRKLDLEAFSKLLYEDWLAERFRQSGRELGLSQVPRVRLLQRAPGEQEIER